MVDKKYFKQENGLRVKRHYNLKCTSCGMVYHDMPILLIQALEKFPKTQEVRCSKGCNTRGTMQARAENESTGDPGMKANWEIVEVQAAAAVPGSFEIPKKASKKDDGE